MPPRARPNYAGALAAAATLNSDRERDEVVELAQQWRRMQSWAGHVELTEQLAKLGQSVDRYVRTL
jgi:hypothetical protein